MSVEDKGNMRCNAMTAGQCALIEGYVLPPGSTCRSGFREELLENGKYRMCSPCDTVITTPDGRHYFLDEIVPEIQNPEEK